MTRSLGYVLHEINKLSIMWSSTLTMNHCSLILEYYLSQFALFYQASAIFVAESTSTIKTFSTFCSRVYMRMHVCACLCVCMCLPVKWGEAELSFLLHHVSTAPQSQKSLVVAGQIVHEFWIDPFGFYELEIVFATSCASECHGG